ncbi:MAG TPA: 3-deoxy-7-phosphoheptulonate synthase [Gammaproteobacteria bacterium]|nr:3-deoxy-7-phosphoheptulonate synthase [Gammaproteobacteria bacterium]
MSRHNENDTTDPGGRLDDQRIVGTRPLVPPAVLIDDLRPSAMAERSVARARSTIEAILQGRDPRLLVIVGPCSIHDVDAALEYARRLKPIADALDKDLFVVMRVYFEKPRTIIGWKGLINDPSLDGSFRINHGLRLARELLLALAELGLPAGCEFLDTITPQYLADLVSWAAIGARTTESQVHRELASGLSMPVGFKNGTDGNIHIALDAIRAAREPHQFLSVSKEGVAGIFATSGNDACHIILRGGRRAANHDAASVAAVAQALQAAGLAPRLMVDCSHGNSGKDYRRQPAVAEEVARQIREVPDCPICGVMLESHLVAGQQNLADGPLNYGQSITDGCIGWDATAGVLETLAAAGRAAQAHATGGMAAGR